jgi:hypothetical protein
MKLSMGKEKALRTITEVNDFLERRERDREAQINAGAGI